MSSHGYFYRQGAFIEAWHFLDSVLTAYECIDSNHTRKRPGAISNLDHEKAYNMVDWEFLYCAYTNRDLMLNGGLE